MPRRLDPIAVVEACYAGGDDKAWLTRLAETFLPLAEEVPPIAYSFRLAQGAFRFAAACDAGPLGPVVRELARFWESAPREVLQTWYSRRHPVVMASSQFARTPSHLVKGLADSFEAARVRDALALVAHDLGGLGVTVTIPYATVRRLPPQTLHLLRCVSAHVCSAIRLRARLAADPSASPDARLSTSGRLLHAEPEARDGRAVEALARGVRAVERARGGLRERNPGEALSTWSGLVSGRWSLVDHVDADGKRFVLARRNEPDVREPLRLAPPERAVLALAAVGLSNKRIAYELGLATSTVATHLARGMPKLQVGSRSELVQLLGPGAPPPVEGDTGPDGEAETIRA